MSESSLPKGQQICAQINKIFESEQSKIANKYINKFLNAEDKKYYDKIKKVFINEMCYTSLALIQKTSFDRAL